MDHQADIAARAEDEALLWLVDFDDLTEVEQARFHAWLDERPENRAAFEKVERDWRRLDVVRALATDRPDPRVIDKWLRRRRLRRRYLPLAAAACIAAIAVAVVLAPRQDYEAAFQTAVGERERIVLPDDSIMTLNTNSEAIVDYDADERRVRLLKGEAHFVITPAARRPFSVAAGLGTVRAIGTAFNVYVKSEVVEVTVTQGVVEILPAAAAAGDAAVRSRSPDSRNEVAAVEAVPEKVREGQRIEYRETIESISRIDPSELARRLAWQDGMLDFQGDTLARVIEEASRYTETRIAIEDPAIENLRVTGYLKAGDVDTLLELIESNERISVRRVAPDLVHLIASGD